MQVLQSMMKSFQICFHCKVLQSLILNISVHKGPIKSSFLLEIFNIGIWSFFLRSYVDLRFLIF